MHYALRTSVSPGLAAFTSVAWDHSLSHPRLATGSVDGTVIVWTAVREAPSQVPEDEPTANSSGFSVNLLGLSTASPQTTSAPGSPTPVVNELPDTTTIPSINITEATPQLTVPLSEKTLLPE